MICFLVSLGVLYMFASSLFLEELQALRQIALVAFGASGDLSPSRI